MRRTALSLASFTVLAVAGCSAPSDTAVAQSEASSAPLREGTTPTQASDSYYQSAAEAVDTRIQQRGVKSAKNVILFVGDGMSIPTITAARIYAGQQRGLDGESYTLTMDTLPHMALSKTYSHDFQVSDSASTATAMVTGAKVNSRTLGILKEASFGNCASVEGHTTDSIFELAERSGLATGLVSTARLTHATPASAFAKTPSRDWEDDSSLKGGAAGDCKDIARQFIEWPEGDGFEVALAGGRAHFTTSEEADPEAENRTGSRTDGRDLTAEWTAKSEDHVYVTDKAGFEAVDFASGAKVLGLFEPSHMKFALDRDEDPAGEPSLVDLTKAAITRLSQDEDGFVLLVEGGRIDHGHHGVSAARALSETDELDQAVAAALEMTNADETLIIVTADHSHTMTISGYPKRGNPILGKVVSGLDNAPMNAQDGKPYTTLSYASGMTACRMVDGEPDCVREDLSDIDTEDKDFQQPSLVFMPSETHGGDDVAIFATGPGSELVSGVMEQNEIFHVMGRASGLVAAPTE
ncbi:alkaline phosphatase [Hyphomonas sp. KY3]|uniref:alkaline phosphatase n=1 Tax=Hyphomonas sp. KY3 TaxID=2016196 RepID=UPI001A8D7CFE|nr:alkaline phosphatase [Hyphomonas sp. KY3]QSR20905.1 alkaline phosphatase [Hyphomonas sp. KY3]